MEPNVTQINLYKEYVSTKANELTNVTFDWRNEAIGDYLSNVDKEASSSDGADNQSKYHFISLIHSAYHLPDMTRCLGQLYDLLEKDGVILIEIEAEGI